MARQFQPTDSKHLFVGRERELEQMARILEEGQSQWLIQIHGDGGIGKTHLLESLRDTVGRGGKKKTWRCTDLIDFHKASLQTAFGLLAEIAQQFGREHFKNFEEQREVYGKVLTTHPDASLYQEAVHGIADGFFKDWRKLMENGVHALLLFDTCEEMHDLASWVTEAMLPQLLKIQQEFQAEKGEAETGSLEIRPQTFVALAGRALLPFPEKMKPHILTLHLEPLSLAEVKEFFRQAKWYPGKIKPLQLKQLNERCGGRPLYLALSYDWLRNGLGLIDDLTGNHAPFGEKLVSWILRLKDVESDVISAAALAWRRLEPGLLAKLLAISENKVLTLFRKLSQFSFVKYRPPAEGFAGNFQLHDEMRDLVKRHLWTRESAWTTKAMLHEVIEWYKTRIGNPDLLAGKELPRTDEMRALLAEYVYYQCELDPNAGSHLGEALFKNAVHYLDLAFCDLLNHEISRFEKSLANDRIDQLRFQQALVAFRKDDYPWARQLWRSLIRRPDCDKKLQATSHLMLVELEGYTGDYDEAFEHAQAAENIFKDLLQQTTLAPSLRELMEKELGQNYKNWGYIYRVKGQWDQALAYYHKALERGGSQKNLARTLNDIGFVHFLQGDAEKAATYVGKALQIRHQLGIAYESGLGHNTLGMIMESMGRIEEAAELFRKAHLYFEASGSARGLALAQINLGRLFRRTNDFDKALKYLMAAKEVLETKGDKAYLIVALNEIGCAHRQQAALEARQLAEKYLQESLDLSEKIKNKQSTADNLEDFQILYCQWGRDLKKQGNIEQGEAYLKIAEDYGRSAWEIAEAHGLTNIMAKIERSSGDVDFEKQDYEKAFWHFFRACELMARAASEKGGPAVQYQRRLAENANRLQQKLHALPKSEQTQKYAEKVLAWIDDVPQDIREPLFLLKTFVTETLQINRYPLALF
jgi:tetratricopeptide (TPR) repeat protein